MDDIYSVSLKFNKYGIFTSAVSLIRPASDQRLLLVKQPSFPLFSSGAMAERRRRYPTTIQADTIIKFLVHPHLGEGDYAAYDLFEIINQTLDVYA
jgi:hypothetical protein